MRRLVRADRMPDYPFEVNFFGLRYRGNLKNRLDWEVFFYGAYEKTYAYFLRDVVKEKPNAVFIDIGANLGHHSIYMSPFCTEIHSFEPYTDVLKSFREKIDINNIQNIKIHNVALGEKNEAVEFYAPTQIDLGVGSFVEGQKPHNKPIGTLTVVNGDDYVEKLNLPNIDLIKIDVEGFEKSVLTGLQKTIKKYRPTITMEILRPSVRTFKNLGEIEALLPDDYEILRVAQNKKIGLFFNRPMYRVLDYNFDVPEADVLLRPKKTQ